MKKLLFILLLAWMVGCEMDAKNVKVPQAQSKLVVTGFISPQDTVIQVQVTQSSPIYGATQSSSQSIQPNIIDATVVLSDGVTSVQLHYEPTKNDPSFPSKQTGNYVISAANLAVLPGKSYFLTVRTPDGREVKAACTVPLQVNDAITTLLDSSDVANNPNYPNPYPRKEYTLTVDWQDTPGEGDYYRIFAEIPLYQSQVPGTGTKSTIYAPINFEQAEEFFKDEGNDGGKFIVKSTRFSQSHVPGTTKAERKVNVYLLTTDKNYYQYHRNLSNNSEDNPFAEPTLVFSNIEGGLGVFAAYQRTTREIRY